MRQVFLKHFASVDENLLNNRRRRSQAQGRGRGSLQGQSFPMGCSQRGFYIGSGAPQYSGDCRNRGA